MTRETKAGLVVTLSFLGLVGAVFMAKMKEQKRAANDPLAEYTAVTPGKEGETIAGLDLNEPKPVASAANSAPVPVPAPQLKSPPPGNSIKLVGAQEKSTPTKAVPLPSPNPTKVPEDASALAAKKASKLVDDLNWSVPVAMPPPDQVLGKANPPSPKKVESPTLATNNEKKEKSWMPTWSPKTENKSPSPKPGENVKSPTPFAQARSPEKASDLVGDKKKPDVGFSAPGVTADAAVGFSVPKPSNPSPAADLFAKTTPAAGNSQASVSPLSGNTGSDGPGLVKPATPGNSKDINFSSNPTGATPNDFGKPPSPSQQKGDIDFGSPAPAVAAAIPVSPTATPALTGGERSATVGLSQPMRSSQGPGFSENLGRGLDANPGVMPSQAQLKGPDPDDAAPPKVQLAPPSSLVAQGPQPSLRVNEIPTATTETPNVPKAMAPVGAPAPVGSPPIVVRPAVSDIPRVESYNEETYRCKQGDSLVFISEKFYNSKIYAQAILQFNRNHPLANSNLLQEVPVLSPGQPIFIPPLRILETQYAAVIPGLQNGIPPAPAATFDAPRKVNAEQGISIPPPSEKETSLSPFQSRTLRRNGERNFSQNPSPQ